MISRALHRLGGVGLVVAVVFSVGCTDDEESLPEEPVGPSSPAVLEVHGLDIWAQALPEGEATLLVTHDGEAVPVSGFPVAQVELWEPGSYSIELSAPEHLSARVTADFDGSRSRQGLAAQLDDLTLGHGLVVSHEDSWNGPAIHRVYLGLRHRWFSAQGRPARRGNQLELFPDGETAWRSVRSDIEAAAESVQLATWSWESNFELTRELADHHLLTPTARRHNTILGILQRSDAHKRIIVGQFWGQDSIASWLTNDSELRAHAEQSGDAFEFMGQGNSTEGQFWFEPAPFWFGDRVRATWEPPGEFDPEAPIPSNVPGRSVDLTEWPIDADVQHASYHQKLFVMDDDVAYLGGMNLRLTDWDAAEHKVFEHRRMPFDASNAERVAVMQREELPNTRPRKDYQVRINGPAAQDVADLFHQRWDYLLSEGAEYADACTPFVVGRDIAPLPEGLQVQVTATFPEPFWEHSIAESWFNAVDNAERFILIEDQYFRAPMLNERIIARMEQVPDLQLVVISKPMAEWSDPGCAQTYIANALYMEHFPARYRTFQLRVFDYVETWGIDETESRFLDMDVHAKMLIVDDLFMSVGSANKNNRGLIYEGELNLAVVDAEWVRAERRRLLASLLPAGTEVADGVEAWLPQLEAAATHNDAVYGAWEAEGWDIDLDGAPLPAAYQPLGWIYGLTFGPLEDCLFESVGPDVMDGPAPVDP